MSNIGKSESDGLHHRVANSSESSSNVHDIVNKIPPSPPRLRKSITIDQKLVLDHLEVIIPRILTILTPIWRFFKLLFGLSILFYGMQFRTIAFHLIVFRISGYKSVLEHWGELVVYYRRVRATARLARQNTLSINESLVMKNKLKIEQADMLRDRKIMLRDGHITEEEMREFLKRHRHQIQKIAEEKNHLAAAKSSLAALRTAIPWGAIWLSLTDLYSALITSITASTYKFAGKLSLAIYCGKVLYEDMLALIGPYIDPLGYEIEFESYIVDILQSPSKKWATAAGILASIGFFFSFYFEPEKGLKIALCFLGSSIVLELVIDFVYRMLNSYFKRSNRFLHFKKGPSFVLLHLLLTSIGWKYHDQDWYIFKSICMPFILLLTTSNRHLNHYSMLAVNFFSSNDEVLSDLIVKHGLK